LYIKSIIKMENICKFLKMDNNKPCPFKLTKKSDYCKLHNYLLKTNKVRPCLECGLGTSAKYQICMCCGGAKIRETHRYHEIIKPWNEEVIRLGKICFFLIHNNTVVVYSCTQLLYTIWFSGLLKR
jgi:hypothetical protein